MIHTLSKECGHPGRQSNCLSPDDIHTQLSQFTEFSYCYVPRHQFSGNYLLEKGSLGAEQVLGINCSTQEYNENLNQDIDILYSREYKYQ